MSEATTESEEFGKITVQFDNRYTGKAIVTWLNRSGYRQSSTFPAEILRKFWSDGFEGGMENAETRAALEQSAPSHCDVSGIPLPPPKR